MAWLRLDMALKRAALEVLNSTNPAAPRSYFLLYLHMQHAQLQVCLADSMLFRAAEYSEAAC